ncbi:MAG TPA: FIST N-terminal domain-containing protein [Dehalococcoidia bacterium]|nr:FIST N-terminal domain-containing protein [Dehalococcoidia bacterium]
MRTGAAAARHPDWREALAELTRQIPLLSGTHEVHLALLFASAEYRPEFPDLVAGALQLTGARLLVGCSGRGVISAGKEIEGEPALALLALSLPEAELTAVHLNQEDLERCRTPQDWHRLTGVAPGGISAWLLFADPFTMDAEALVDGLSAGYPGTPLVGGLASGDPRLRGTHLFLNGEVYDHGAVALALGGPYTVRTIVSQGAAPIGETWTITGARGHIIETIAQRPAYQVLVDTLRTLPAEMQRRVQRNLLVGLAMDERRSEFRRGDFLIRNLMGIDPERGTLAVGALPRVGQTLQFQLRDPNAADEDLRELLERAQKELGGRLPVGALLCSCNGRGVGLFGTPDHDARTLADLLGPIPVTGFFCNGEIGPVGERNFLHGFTASIALLIPEGPERQAQ